MSEPKPLPYALQRLIDAVENYDIQRDIEPRLRAQDDSTRDVLVAAAREAASAWRSIYGHVEASPGFGRVPDPREPAEPIAVWRPHAFVDLARADEAVRIAATPGKGVLIDDFRSDQPLLITHELTYDEVDRIAMERCAQWHPPESEPWTIVDWTNAVCGEAGELANIAKKIRRITTGTKVFESSSAREGALAELRAKAAKELADVELYLPMVANALGVHRATGVVAKFNEVSVREGFPQRLRQISPSAGADQPHDFAFSVDGGCRCGEPQEHPVHTVRSVPLIATDSITDGLSLGSRLAAGETIEATEIRHDDPKPADPPGSARHWAGGGFHTGPQGRRRCGCCYDCMSPFPVWCEAWGTPPPHIALQQAQASVTYWRHHAHGYNANDVLAECTKCEQGPDAEVHV